MELTTNLKTLFVETAKRLSGHERRRFMAQTVRELGPGGQRLAERDLGWNRRTIRKGLHELDSGFTCLDSFSLRRRKFAEEKLPNLLQDIRSIVDAQSQTDPQFRSNRLYTRISVAAVRRQLIEKSGYSDVDLPTERTISTKLRQLGYYPKRVAKTQPQKKLPKPMQSSNT